MTLSAAGAAVTNDRVNALPCANMRVPSELGVSAVIGPLAKPPYAVERLVQATAVVEFGVESEADAGAARRGVLIVACDCDDVTTKAGIAVCA